MKEIGGYFGLELGNKDEYHQNALGLNSGRSCFLYILKAQQPTKVYIPSYICNSILEPLVSERVPFEFYNINENFDIEDNIELKENEKLLYVNYFGLKSDYVKSLVGKYNESIIIDNTQNFYEPAINNIDTFYSPRKFFGVSDGGYLYTNKQIEMTIERDSSTAFAMQLLGRLDKNAGDYYELYNKAENRLVNQPIKLMSNITRAILKSVNYEEVMQKRKCNFEYLHSKLKEKNKLNFDIPDLNVNAPMVYPFVSNEPKLKSYLIAQKIYVANYWKEVKERKGCSELEKKLVDQLVPLPIDQRYGAEDMNRVLSVLTEGVYE